ncbi:MAG: intein-containing DNA-dependent RNA polymerase 2 subunit Rpb2/subunit Rpb4 precursor [Faunusvirus sp.]|jgi:DNA-directed RNA polymerase beta subunit|uniref:DNA-directed RNA polymerase n=1 Tax=Faunusvirus sp. TaxID=2487766 RepID=A0A3G5A1T8_9VIRU|nr:MAG: intein-containing DNA-dependent RNA polymerase 2 subunit Rpb2/subunit Rpb4 precursor [Faunusvirus sp.]
METESKTTKHELTNKDVLPVVDLIFEEKHWLYRHQQESFAQFIDEIVYKELKEVQHTFHEDFTKDKIYRNKFVFDDIALRPPYNDLEDCIMWPQDARTKNLTYASKLLCSVKQIQEVITIASDQKDIITVGETQRDVPVAKLPVALRSKYCTLSIRKDEVNTECRHDPGGYFIVNGGEKVVMCTERICENKLFCFVKKDTNYKNNLMYYTQVNSKSNDVNSNIQLAIVKMKKDETIIMSISQLTDVPIFIMFRALGIVTDHDILRYIIHDMDDTEMLNVVRNSISNSIFDPSKPPSDKNRPIKTQEDAIEYLMNTKMTKKKYSESDKNIQILQKKMHLMKVLTKDFLPHQGESLINKACFLGMMAHRLISCYIGRVPVEDRDRFTNKRIETPGVLLGQLFKQYFKKMIGDCGKYFKKKNQDPAAPINIINQIKASVVEQGIKSCLSSGTWGTSKNKRGVAQTLQRLTYLQTVSYLRRIITPCVDAATNKVVSIRQVNNIQYGYICVTGDTRITLEDGSKKQIKYFDESETVLSVNEKTLLIEPTKIKKFFKIMPDKLYKIKTCGGRVIKCTGDHPLLTKKRTSSDNENKTTTQIWKKTSELLAGDKLIVTRKLGSYQKGWFESDTIALITEIPVEPVYDFETISSNHSFIANGIVSHNCAVESPDGHNVGIVKHLALSAGITMHLQSQVYIIKNLITNEIIALQDVDPSEYKKKFKIFINGEWIGLHTNPLKLADDLRAYRTNGVIDRTVSIVADLDNREIRIYSDGGRLIRPLLRVKDNKLLITKKQIADISIGNKTDKNKIHRWNDLLSKYSDIIDLMDMDESEYAMIAMYVKDVATEYKKMNTIITKPNEIGDPNNRYNDTVYKRYTHCELHPMLQLGHVSGLVPFGEHNPSPRNMFFFAQTRQALGIYASNYRFRMDISYILYNTQTPLVTTRAMKYTGIDEMPAGENAIVAIACYTG